MLHDHLHEGGQEITAPALVSIAHVSDRLSWGGKLIGALGTPAIAFDTVAKRYNIFARSRRDSSVQQSAWNGGWSAWARLEGCSKDGVFAVARPAARASSGASLDVLATGCNAAGRVSANDSGADVAWQRPVGSQ